MLSARCKNFLNIQHRNPPENTTNNYILLCLVTLSTIQMYGNKYFVTEIKNEWSQWQLFIT